MSANNNEDFYALVARMSGQKNGWDDENIEPGAFGHLLERMSHQFTPNHDSHHYQTGFVPAASPHWSSHHHNQQQTSFTQHNTSHPHVISLDPASLGGQVGLNSSRSYSVSQDPFPDMGGDRTPLLRSSSDLGMRIAHYPTHSNSFPDCHLDGILDDQVQSLDGSAFFPENVSLSHGNNMPPLNHSPSSFHVPTSSNEIMRNQQLCYGSYMPGPETPNHETSSNNFATKFSNFRASLGTWFTPSDQFRTNYSSCSSETLDLPENSSKCTSSSLPEDSPQCSADLNTFSSLSPNLPGEQKADITTKLSYSDVLTKAPTQEGKSYSNNASTSTNKSVSFQSASVSQKPPRESSGRLSGGKSKGRVIAPSGRSNSPNTNSMNNFDTSYSGKHNPKFDSSYSKVGLDDFDLPDNISNYNSSISGYNSSISNYMNNLNNNSKPCNIENVEKNKKRTSLTSEDSSPSHQAKKSVRNESKKLSEKFEESPVSSDGEKSQSDKLNNHTLSTQQKQTPKKTTYINNNLASSSSGTNSLKTVNAANCSNSSIPRKVTTPPKDEPPKFQYDAGIINSNNKSTYPTAGLNFTTPVPPNTTAVGGGGNRSGNSSGFRNNRNSNKSKMDRGKEPQNKKNFHKRKKDPTAYCQSDLIMTGWTMCLLWFSMIAKAGLWIISLITDVVQMSYRLLVHFTWQIWTNEKLQLQDIKNIIHGYFSKCFGIFSKRKTENKKTGRNDRKSPSGLDSNIPLPTTGEEAMKRLLACRGKDPYSILGVTHDCTDDDIKKYYKRQAFLVHPDKNKQPGAEEAFKILAHAFEIIGEPERRQQYDTKLAEEVHFEGAWGELASLLNRLKEKLEEAANTIRCTNCNKRHKRVKLPRPIYAARHCAECQIRHAAREGDIWAESSFFGLRWKYYACMEGAIYDISEWAACQKDNLKHLQANTHSVQYRIVSGKKNSGGKNSAPECPTDPELEEFFNNLCRERFGQDFMPGSNQPGSQQTTNSSDIKKRRGKKKK